MIGRTLRFALFVAACQDLPASAEELEWRSPGLRQNVALCAALFHVRTDWMVGFVMDPTASGGESGAALELQRIYGERVPTLGFRPYVPPEEGRPPLIRGPLTRSPTDLGPEVYWARQKLVNMFTASGAMKHRPPVCLEDATCASCWDLLRAMQTRQ